MLPSIPGSRSARADSPPTIGVIGGSGLYRLAESQDLDLITMETPYGAPSGPISIAVFAGRRVAFLARHGEDHSLPPHKINYRANLWALARLGVRAIVSSTAVGGLSANCAPGSFVLPDQVIDRTWGRADTFFDGPNVQHLAAAEPYCPLLRSVAADVMSDSGETFQDHGTCVVIPGPRFSTRAESRWYSMIGADIVNMTQYPEVVLAAELNIGLVNLSFVTDADADGSDDSADAALVLRRLAAAGPRITGALAAIVAAIPADYAGRELIDPAAVSSVLAQTVVRNGC